jgi:DNA-binding HxlR family transcriptional regulator
VTQPSDASTRPCGIARDAESRGVLEHSTGRWGVLILVALVPGAARFTRLKRKVPGISDRMLSQVLQRLEQHGVVSRTAQDRKNSRVDYALTPPGSAIADQLVNLIAAIEEQMPAILEAQRRYEQEDDSTL